MSTEIQKPMSQIRAYIESDAIKKQFTKLLGEKAQGFITGVLQVVNNNNLLQKATPQTIYNAAATAAILDLPINNSLGFAYIVPYGSQAQFQLGYKGLIQLAQRTGLYKAINATPVFENQFKSFNALTEELDADFSVDGEGAVVGYAAYFKLLNGFEKTVYWSMSRVKKHGERFSKTFRNGPWKDDFDSMACKTVLKQALSKFGPMSIEMQRAVVSDQAIIKDVETQEVEYVDNPNEHSTDILSQEFLEGINAAQGEDDFEILMTAYPSEWSTTEGQEAVNARRMMLNATK